MNKFFLIILFSTLLSNCSYEPILTKKNYNFGFEQINSEGETKVNNIIKRKLDRNNDNDNKFDLFFETKKLREIIAQTVYWSRNMQTYLLHDVMQQSGTV